MILTSRTGPISVYLCIQSLTRRVPESVHPLHDAIKLPNPSFTSSPVFVVLRTLVLWILLHHIRSEVVHPDSSFRIAASDRASSFPGLPLSLDGSVPRNQLLADPAVLIADHCLLKRICPLPWVSGPTSFQQSLCTNSILLRRY